MIDEVIPYTQTLTKEIMQGIFFDADLLAQNYAENCFLTLTVEGAESGLIATIEGVSSNDQSVMVAIPRHCSIAEVGNGFSELITVTAMDSLDPTAFVTDSFTVLFDNPLIGGRRLRISLEEDSTTNYTGQLFEDVDYYLKYIITDQVSIPISDITMRGFLYPTYMTSTFDDYFNVITTEVIHTFEEGVGYTTTVKKHFRLACRDTENTKFIINVEAVDECQRASISSWNFVLNRDYTNFFHLIKLYGDAECTIEMGNANPLVPNHTYYFKCIIWDDLPIEESRIATTVSQGAFNSFFNLISEEYTSVQETYFVVNTITKVFTIISGNLDTRIRVRVSNGEGQANSVRTLAVYGDNPTTVTAEIDATRGIGAPNGIPSYLLANISNMNGDYSDVVHTLYFTITTNNVTANNNLAFKVDRCDSQGNILEGVMPIQENSLKVFLFGGEQAFPLYPSVMAWMPTTVTNTYFSFKLCRDWVGYVLFTIRVKASTAVGDWNEVSIVRRIVLNAT